MGKIRFHENAGEVHFHDDAAGLKVAMPSATWIELWDKVWSGEAAKRMYPDPVNSTLLIVELIEDGGTVEASLSIESAKFGKAFAKLQKFTEAT